MTARLESCSQCGKLVHKEEMVIIPASEYRDLLARPMNTTETPFMGKPARSTIGRDRELAEYIVELAAPGTMFLDSIRAACLARFGAARVPSRTAIHRFIHDSAKGRRPQAVERRV
ncbi:MAG TPA: hypothetical protein VL133_02890 [Devosia sp.]|nr:hypothetical protein [Devosia sp.]